MSFSFFFFFATNGTLYLTPLLNFGRLDIFFFLLKIRQGLCLARALVFKWPVPATPLTPDLFLIQGQNEGRKSLRFWKYYELTVLKTYLSIQSFLTSDLMTLKAKQDEGNVIMITSCAKCDLTVTHDRVMMQTHTHTYKHTQTDGK